MNNTAWHCVMKYNFGAMAGSRFMKLSGLEQAGGQLTRAALFLLLSRQVTLE